MFLTYVLGGPHNWAGQPLTGAHAKLHVTDEAFDTVAHHLLLTLEDLDVDRPLVRIIMGFVEGARTRVVGGTGR